MNEHIRNGMAVVLGILIAIALFAVGIGLGAAIASAWIEIITKLTQ